MISCIQWIDATMVAVNCVENKPLDQRMEGWNRSRTSSILIWNLSQISLNAQTVLTAPSDIKTFKFHPKNKKLVVGGLENGQIALWDLAKSTDSVLIHKINAGAAEQNESAERGDGVGDDEKAPLAMDTLSEGDEVRVREVAPLRVSVIEKSHRVGVAAIEWVAGGVVMAESGQCFKSKADDRSPHQFVSVGKGGDTVLFWDTATPQQTEKERKRKEAAKWAPIHSLKMTVRALAESKLFADVEAMNAVMTVDGADGDDPAAARETVDDDVSSELTSGSILGSKMCATPLLGKLGVGTVSGGFCLLNLGQITSELVAERGSVLNYASCTTSDWLRVEDEKQKLSEKEMERSIVRALRFRYSRNEMTAHHLGVRSVAMSPHFADIALTVGDWRFCVWRGSRLIFESPYSSSYLCCGCWAPSRPAVLLMAKHDGTMDIWDLLDQTHSAVISNAPICSTPITAISFCPFSPSNVAVADCGGNLRIITIPTTFTLPLRHEKTMIARFYQKEEAKTVALRQREKHWQHLQKEAEKANNEQTAAEPSATNHHQREDQPLESDEVVQQKYENMLIAFKKKLGITD